MKQAVQAVKQYLILQREAELARTVVSDGRADENFTIGKSDDVGLGGIVHELAVDAGNGGAVDEDDVDFREICRQRARQER